MFKTRLGFTVSVLIHLTLLVVMVGASGLPHGHSASQALPPRTFYDAIDLSTPETAAHYFVDAFQRNDYVSVYWILSYEAQNNIARDFARFRIDSLIRIAPDTDRNTVLRHTPLFGLGVGRDAIEHSAANTSYLFDGLMLAAKAHNAFVIDLRNTVEFVSRQDNVVFAENRTAVDIFALVKGIDGFVRFRMVQSATNRWRVYSVMTPGGDETQVPWSA